jgi:hypothetical protein
MTFQIQHKRSGDFARRPSPSDLNQGQLALNYNPETPGLFFKTDNGTIVKVGPVHVGASAPQMRNWTERSVGELWLDISITGSPLLKVWTNQGWLTVSTLTTTANLFIPPTSTTGLPSGAVWNNNGVLSIVP